MEDRVDLISRAEAQEIAGVSKPTILAAIYRGDLRAVRVGGHWVVRRAEAEEWARRRLSPGRPPRLPETAAVTE